MSKETVKETPAKEFNKEKLKALQLTLDKLFILLNDNEICINSPVVATVFRDAAGGAGFA